MHKFDEQTNNLISKMSTSEKISQLRYNSKAIKHLNIPRYNWWNECLHGVARGGIATVFPQAIAMASTFSEEILGKVADIISTEARAKHHEAVRNNDRGIYKGLTFWSPNINIFRDPRWGRGQETYGEDPYLTSRLGVAFIKGLQGSNDKWLKVSACAKHFAVHSGPEADRHTFNAEVSKKDLFETYLPAFEAAVREAKVESVMGAYNRVNGEGCCASDTLINRILRDGWGFQGHFVSDCGAILDIIYKHKIAKNPLKGVALSINSGCDLECGIAYSLLPISVRLGYVKKQTIDKSLYRIMLTRMKLGMFDNDCEYNQIPYSMNATRENEDYAIEVAGKSIVLLTNNGILPLKQDNKTKYCIIGPNARNNIAMLGNYSGEPSSYIYVDDALKEYVNKENLYYHKGTNLYKFLTAKEENEQQTAILEAICSDIIIMCLGLDSTIEGEQIGGGGGDFGAQGDRCTLDLPKVQLKLLDKVIALNKNVIILNFSGGTVNFSKYTDKVDAILQCWYPGAKAGKAIADILFGKISPSGKLPVTVYASDKDLADFDDYSMNNRTYRYFKGKPLFPFGYGLSYTKFSYSNLTADSLILNDKITLKFDIKNSGKYTGDEVIETYIIYPESNINTPIRSLIYFRRITLQAGSTETITIELPSNKFTCIDNDGNTILLNGKFKLSIGGSASDEFSEKLNNSKCLNVNITNNNPTTIIKKCLI